MKAEEYKKQIKRSRQEKDKFFSSHPQSPIPVNEQESFTGLDYFEPDPKYRFRLELEEFEEKDTVKINDTGGNLREYLVWGKFTFALQDKTCTLFAYKSNPEDEHIFVPFKDETSGKETYGAGKYLELYEERDKIDQNKWALDFNLATNPWCAYNPKYVCPLIPSQNILEVRIPAGEKNYEK